jgi:DNA-3-methyladenine glycosylase
MPALTNQFYLRKDVTRVARQLLGKNLITNISGKTSVGRIVETEAYSYREKGCHAFGNRMTARNKAMFLAGGSAYVYLCYGIHHLFNIVTNKAGMADAVLIRALEPIEGELWMMERMNVNTSKRITSGPGKLTKAMGIDRTYDGTSLSGFEICLEEGIKVTRSQIEVSTRIGIDYAGKDALLPWRFSIKDNPWVSK